MSEAITKSEHLKTAYANLESLIKQKFEAMPKGFNQTRFLQNAMAVLQDTKDIEKVKPSSIARTMLHGAFLGLDFFSKECYAIPYGGSLQFQTDYKGEIKLAKQYSITPIKDIYAKLVREDDIFEECIIDGKQTLSFKPKPFNNKKIIGAFAVCIYTDSSMFYETMSIEDVETVRDKYSKVSTGKAWTVSFGEMARKTVLRRLTKHIPRNFDKAEQDQAWEAASDVEFEHKEVLGKPVVAMPRAIETKKPIDVLPELPKQDPSAEPTPEPEPTTEIKKDDKEESRYKEMLDRFANAKKSIGDDEYYNLLGSVGYKHANEIPNCGVGDGLLTAMRNVAKAQKNGK